MKLTRRWLKYLFIIAALAIFFVFPASADANPAAAIRMQGGDAILYNPTNQQAYENLKDFQEVPEGSGFFYYFKNKNGAVYNSGRFSEGGKTYLAYEDGHLAIGLTEIGSRAFYFMKDGTLARQSIIKADNNIFYYAGKNGKLKTGLKKINGAYYYFDPASYQMRFGWIEITSGKLYMKGAGNQIGQAVIGWMTLDGNKYYFNKKGLLVHGWLTLNGKKYYLDPETGACFTGKKTIDGKDYDFGTTGALVDPAATATGPWIVKVNQSTCTVTIYRGNTPIKAFCCSVGLNNATPDGTFSILDHLRWHELMGPSWGQWCSHVTSDILFHSIPYSKCNDKYSMSTYGYNHLGQPASHGCIRLAAINAKYIYDNVPIGSRVIIFHGSAKDDPLGKPMPPKVGSWSKSYDPTDPTI